MLHLTLTSACLNIFKDTSQSLMSTISQDLTQEEVNGLHISQWSKIDEAIDDHVHRAVDENEVCNVQLGRC